MNNKGLYPYLSLILIWIVFGNLSAQATDVQSTHFDQLRAAYTINFAKLVRKEPGTDQSSSFNLCLLGKDRNLYKAFGDHVGQTINQKPIQVFNYYSTDYVSDCDIVYVAYTEKLILGEILEALKQNPVLTVSDIGGFVTKGGMFEFNLTNNRLGFLANPFCAQRQGLRINSALLNLAINRKSFEEQACE